VIPSRVGWVLCWCFTHDGLGNALCHKSPQLLLPPPLLLCVRQVSDVSHSHFVFLLSRGDLELVFEDDNIWVINFQCLTIPGKVVNISCQQGKRQIAVDAGFQLDFNVEVQLEAQFEAVLSHEVGLVAGSGVDALSRAEGLGGRGATHGDGFAEAGGTG